MSEKAITLAIPRGDVPLNTDPRQAFVVFDATEVQTAEARLFEVATVTPHKANELLALFNNAFLQSGKALTQARYQHVKAEQMVARRKAVFLTDLLPAKIAEKGLGTKAAPLGPEDVRSAFLELDEEYGKLVDRRDQIKALVELLSLKQKTFENAYTSVKKILGETNFTARNGDLSGGHGDDNITAGDNVEQRPYRWGAPKD